MEKKIYQPGSIIHKIGDELDSLLLIQEGTVNCTYEGGQIQLKTGDVIGISGIHSHCYLMDAQAVTATTVVSSPCSDGEFINILKKNKETRNYFVTSILRQILALFAHYKKQKKNSTYLYKFLNHNHTRYLEICEKNRISPRTLPGQDDIHELVIENDIESWLDDCYKGLYQIIAAMPDPEKINPEFYFGMIMLMSTNISRLIVNSNHVNEYTQQLLNFFINEDRHDFLELYSSAYFRAYHLADAEKPDPALLNDMTKIIKAYGVTDDEYGKFRLNEYQEKLKNADQQKPGEDGAESASDLNGSLYTILEYAGCPEETNDAFTKQLKIFKKTVNKSGTEEADRKNRNVITKYFYEIYNATVLKSLTDPAVPRIIKMFLHFGYMDEELAGAKNAAYLYKIVEHLPTDAEKGTYTFYEWLMAIYNGKKEPSRNEFDSDFQDYVNELVKNKKIDKTEAAEMMNDSYKKLVFELESVLPTVNKVTNGRIATFCPVFSEHLALKTLIQMLVTTDMIHELLTEIRDKDFGAFVRDGVYSNPEIGIAKETIQMEILPDIILAPNIGIRGLMWQEIEGKRRNTPARFMLSLFQADELKKIMYRMTADFRWEMCKRIQGARWNDTSEPSLTSDYSDYLASFRKNIELSGDVKEKIKSDLGKCKNNTKEMFIGDYQNWLLFESNGSPRLNKIARKIMIMYCPFSLDIRERIRANPFYTEAMEKYDVRLKMKLKPLGILSKSLKIKGFEMPEEIVETIRLLKS